MQEKDIREKLNQELEQMAPDMLEKILSKPIEPVKSEKELFGKNKPLFKQENNWKQYFKVPAVAAVAACFVALIIALYPMFGINSSAKTVAFSIIVDVNPSISIDVNEDGTVNKVKAKNKDAKKIVNYVNSELDEEDDYKTAMELVVKNLKKEGYLKKKKNAMLVSAIPADNGNDITEQLLEVRRRTNETLETRNIECKTVYQKVKTSDKIKRTAEKNNVSIGKAALCIELAKENKTSVSKMCKKNIAHLVKEIEKRSNNIVDSIIIVSDNHIEYVTEETSVAVETESTETESIVIPVETSETESVSETVENPAETSAGFEETTSESSTTYFTN